MREECIYAHPPPAIVYTGIHTLYSVLASFFSINIKHYTDGISLHGEKMEEGTSTGAVWRGAALTPYTYTWTEIPARPQNCHIFGRSDINCYRAESWRIYWHRSESILHIHFHGLYLCECVCVCSFCMYTSAMFMCVCVRVLSRFLGRVIWWWVGPLCALRRCKMYTYLDWEENCTKLAQRFAYVYVNIYGPCVCEWTSQMGGRGAGGVIDNLDGRWNICEWGQSCKENLWNGWKYCEKLWSENVCVLQKCAHAGVCALL